jgi:hypothetical protein
VGLYTRHDVRLPEHPVLVVAMEGWIDAGLAASTASAILLESLETEIMASFDGDELIDQRARRPQMRIADGVHAGLSFQEPVLRVGTDRLGSGVALLVGPEPDFRWRGFSAAVLELVTELDVRLVVGFGGFPAAAPHTRPVRLAATASSAELAEKVGFISGVIDVPSGANGAIEVACAGVGIPAVGLWARVPHYCAAMAFPPAALALLDGLAAVSGLVIDTAELREAAEAGRRNVDELVAANPEHVAMVRELEERVDDSEGLPPDLGLGIVPSGEEIAAEFERYLRDENR